MIEIRAQQVLATIWLIKTLYPKHGKVLILQLTMITSCRSKTLIRNGRQAKERAITDKMLNSARADLISIDHTTALICASVLTRARYSINGVNEVSVRLRAAYHGCRNSDDDSSLTNCDVINIRNTIITSESTILADTGN